MIERAPIAWRMPPGYAALLVALVLAAIAIAATGSNVALFHAIQHAARVVPLSLYPSIWESLTYAGDTLAAFALATVLLALRPDAAWAGLVAAAPAGIYSHALKAIFPMPRPPSVLAENTFVVLGPVLKQASFPSGHSVTAGVLAGVVFLAYRNAAIRAFALVVASLIGLSRIAVGVHWPIDVVAGLFGGLLSAWFGTTLATGQLWTTTPSARAIISTLLGGCALSLVFHPAGLPDAAGFRYALAFVGVVLAIVAIRRAALDWNSHRTRIPPQDEQGPDDPAP